MRRRSLFLLVMVAVVVLGGGAYAAERWASNEPILGAGHFLGANPVITTTQASPTPTPTPTPTPVTPTLRAPADPADITVTGTSLFGWAFYDRRTDETVGSKNYSTVHNTTESMIKPWIAGDYLRQLDATGKTPTKAALNDLTLMLIDSNDVMAQKYYAMDGHNAVINRFIKICGLKSVTYRSGWWSYTNITPADAIRYARCIADGRVAGPNWTDWLLATMKKPRGGVKDQISTTKEGGHWGVIDGLPTVLKTTISWKNGWTYQYDATWHINCMAISPDWILVVEMHTTSLQKGADICASVTRQLVVTE